MIKKIKEFLRENVTKDVEKVISELLYILKESSKCRNSVVLIAARHERWRDEIINGTSSKKESSVEISEITKNILDIINSFQDEDIHLDLPANYYTYNFSTNEFQINPFLFRKESIQEEFASVKYTGNANEINISKVPDLKKTFICGGELMFFKSNHMRLMIRKDTIFGFGSIENHHRDGTREKGEVSFVGEKEDGMAFIKYNVREFETIRNWTGVASFKISKSFDLYGYWMTEDIYERGWFVFGSLSLNPVFN